MQKVRLQIMFTANQLNMLHTYQLSNNLKNESEAIGMILISHDRLQIVIKELEKKAHEAEEWKERAENKGGMPTKHTIATDANVSTDGKQQSVGSTKRTRKRKGAD